MTGSPATAGSPANRVPYDREPYDDDRRIGELRAVEPDLMLRLRWEEMKVDQMTPAQARAAYTGPRFPFLFGTEPPREDKLR